MALVSQSIKNLKGGISQQPDILRYPDQGEAQVNGWSSETSGLQKRPPIVFNKFLGPEGYLGSSPMVHLINRDEFEQYYVVFTGTDVKVFDMSGTEYTVRGERSYITTSKPREALRMVTVADYTFIVNREKVVEKSPEKTNGGLYRPKGDALVNVRGGQYGRTLSITLNGTKVAEYTIPNGSNPDDVKFTDAQTLAEELASQGRTKAPTFTWTVGTGYIHIQAPEGTDIESLTTKDGYADQLINPVTHYVQSFNKLPLNAPSGYIVKIVGDTSKTADQYYVVYDTEQKVWKETAGWNIEYAWHNETMPWTLIRASDGQFDLIPQDWTGRRAGDDATNPYPSILDSKINDVFFFRNRLGFISGENIVLSRTSRYFDFWPASVANLSDDDPIDVAVSHNRVSILKYAVPFSEELLLWSDEAQFVLGAAGILTSKSVELNLTTQFDVQDRARPYGIGRNIYYAATRARFSSINRYYAVQDVSSVKSSEDITSHVPSYIPNGVFSIHGSSSENFATVLTEGSPSRIYVYKFMYDNEELVQKSWSHWELGEGIEVVAATTIGSRMNLLLRSSTAVWSARLIFTSHTKDFDGEPYQLALDNKTSYVIPAGSFDEDTFITTIDLETVYGMKLVGGSLSVVEEDGRQIRFDEPEGGWESDSTLKLDGDLSGKRVFIGFNIPFSYQLSRLLIKKTADDGSVSTEDVGRLQLRRAWINFEESGAFTVEVQTPANLFSYTMAGGKLGSDQLRAGRLNIDNGQFRFPVAGNAYTTHVTVKSDAVTPLSIIGCGWEGNYMRRSSGI